MKGMPRPERAGEGAQDLIPAELVSALRDLKANLELLHIFEGGRLRF